MKEMNEHYWNTYNSVNDLIKFADTKAAVIFTVFGVFYSIVISNFEGITTIWSISELLIYVAMILIIIFSAISLYYAYKCLNPDLRPRHSKSVFFFGEIIERKDSMEYYNDSSKIFNSEEISSKALADRIHEVSDIVNKKFGNVGKAMKFLYYSIILIIVSISILLIEETYNFLF